MTKKPTLQQNKLRNNFLHINKANSAPSKNAASAPFYSLTYTKKLAAVAGFSGIHINRINSDRLSSRNNFLSLLRMQQNSTALRLNSKLLFLLTFLTNSNFYKGLRLKKHLPLRGQRTHTNASTARKLNYSSPAPRRSKRYL